METNYFGACSTKDEARNMFRRLVKQHHPDVGGNEETFKAIKAELESRLEGLPDQVDTRIVVYDVTGRSRANGFSNVPDSTLEKLGKIRPYLPNGVQVVVKGSWIWIEGHKDRVLLFKDLLKSEGFFFSGKHSQWMWGPKKPNRRFRSKMSSQDIDRKYGRVTV